MFEKIQKSYLHNQIAQIRRIVFSDYVHRRWNVFSLQSQ